jgi:hypothetical protein
MSVYSIMGATLKVSALLEAVRLVCGEASTPEDDIRTIVPRRAAAVVADHRNIVAKACSLFLEGQRIVASSKMRLSCA